MPVNLRGRHYLKLLDYTPAEIRYLLELSKDFKRMKRAGTPHRYLAGKNIVLLFEKTVNDDPMADIIEMAVEARGIEMDEYCEKLTSLTELYLEQIDAEIEANLRGWSLRRLSRMTLTILRVAVCEMKFMKAPDVPVSVSINEAVELAKRFSGDDGPSFVNGVLAKITAKES